LARQARAERAGWLEALGTGMVTLGDLLLSAGLGGHSLGKIRLDDLFYALMRTRYPTSATQARRASRAAFTDLKKRLHVRSDALTVSWLLAKRAGNRRLDALAETLGRTTRSLPSERWPYR
jgi:hypothetical protein